MFDQLNGRECHVLARALTLAIAVIERLPKELAPPSDQAEMKRMMEALYSSDVLLQHYQERAEVHLQAITADPK
jgi:hypothetical protein